MGARPSNPLPKILVIDDEPSVRAFLARALASHAAKVGTASDARSALEAVESADFDLIISDIFMPECKGTELLVMAQHSQWDVGIILMTGRVAVEEVISALRLRAFDFLFKPFTIEDLHQAVMRSFQRLEIERDARAYRQSLEQSIQRRTTNLEEALRSLESNYTATLEALVAALDAREHETYAHSFRVRGYTAHLARLVGYPPALLPQLEHAALLHDIGKIAVTDSILLKPAKLDDAEWTEMKKHAAAGEQILTRIAFLQPAAKIVRHHHERFDGTGYPDGMRGEEIPLGDRLFVFADTLDAMTSDRHYRKAPGFAAVVNEVKRCCGTQFDPRLVDVFLPVPESTWRELREQVERQRSASATLA